MRTTGHKRTEATQGAPHNRVRAEASTGENSKPLTQDELLKWWPFDRLDPKRFPRRVKHDDVEDALL